MTCRRSAAAPCSTFACSRGSQAERKLKHAMSRQRRPYRLTRYFSLAALAGMALLVYGLAAFDRDKGHDQLMEHETRANAAVANALVASAWPRYAGLVAEGSSMSRRELLRREEIRGLRESADRLRAHTHVVRVELLSPGGLTVFSSDPARIGLQRSRDAGLAAA